MQEWHEYKYVLKKERNANPKVMAIFYKIVIQPVLLNDSESWVMTQHTKNEIQDFHRRCARHITGRHITVVNDLWMIYPDSKKKNQWKWKICYRLKNIF